MSPETAAVIVAELQRLRDEMSQNEMAEFDNCVRLLSNPHYTNREQGKMALLLFSAKFLDPGRVATQ